MDTKSQDKPKQYEIVGGRHDGLWVVLGLSHIPEGRIVKINTQILEGNTNGIHDQSNEYESFSLKNEKLLAME